MQSLENNDIDLLLKIKAFIAERNEKAIELLYDHYYDKLTHFAQTFGLSQELGEEIVDDIFLRFWSNPLLVQNINNLSVYLYKSVKNGCLTALKKNDFTFPSDFTAVSYSIETGTASALDHLVLSEMYEVFQVAVHNLPPRCRLIFTLIREDGLAYKEVAEILGISVNTIDCQMAIAITRICAALGISKKVNTSRFRNFS